MALTYSSMIALDSKIPHFELENVLDGQMYASSSLSNDKPSLIMVICNHCPYVIHYHEELKRMNSDFGDKIDFVAISSNDIINYPQDGPEQMKELFLKLGLSFPYLFDETQDIAKSYSAVCTPDIFLYDADRKLKYRGRLDDNWKEPEGVTREELKMAIDATLSGNEIEFMQIPSMGCNIKWKN